MKIKSIIFAALFVMAAPIFAQIEGTAMPFNEDFWEETPTLTELTEDEKQSNAVFLADIQVINYEYGSFVNPITGQMMDDRLIEENLHYKRIRLNNDKAVERFNKVFISTAGGKKVTNLKARAITKDGKLIEFDDSNKKEVENYENYGPFTIFALEGIEVGSEIEYTYTTKELAYSFYFSCNVQDDYPKRNFHYEINSPEALVFKMKSYNGLPEMINDTSALQKEINRYVLKLPKVEKFKEEDYSKDNSLKQRIEVKLFENKAANKRNFYSYSEAATEYSKVIYGGKSEKDIKKEAKAIKGLIKSQKWDKIKDKKDQIIAIEHYLKSKFDFGKTGKYYIHEPVKQKVYSKQNAVRIYAHIFEQLDIDHQVVLTCNRFDGEFDEEFETYNYLETYLFYFPKLDQFMSPMDVYVRLGLIPSAYAYTKGLFLKTVKIGGIRSAYPEVKEIPGTMTKVNYDNFTADIEFDEDFEKVKAHVKHEASGYSAAYLRPVMSMIDNEEKKKEILEDRLKSFAEDAEVTNITSANEEMKGYMLEKPYIFEGDVSSSALIEKAGKKYLFKLGQVIGAQVEMYQDTARKFPVENSYNHGYLRTLKIKIPEGYKITNLEDLNMDFSSSKDGEKTMEFTSKYELDGNLLTVICNEYYDEISVPLERYEEFRTVINAAADFNKITLVFEEE